MDIDGDGHIDILSGSYSRMENDMAGLFHVFRGKKGGGFGKAEVLKGTDGKPLIIPGDQEKTLVEKICTRPFAVDLDGDGNLDLVVGNFGGTFYVFKGKGKGQFDPKPEMLLAGKDPLRVKGGHSDPFVIDLDGDGDLDIVSGSSDGGVYWAENIAGKGKPPVFAQFRPLIKPPEIKKQTTQRATTVKEEDLKGPTRATRVWVADVNGDGKLDLLVGDSVTLTAPAKGLTEAEMKKQLEQWEKDFSAAAEAMRKAKGETEEKKAREEYNKVYRRRSEIVKEEMTGFVWLYLQK